MFGSLVHSKWASNKPCGLTSPTVPQLIISWLSWCFSWWPGWQRGERSCRIREHPVWYRLLYWATSRVLGWIVQRHTHARATWVTSETRLSFISATLLLDCVVVMLIYCWHIRINILATIAKCETALSDLYNILISTHVYVVDCSWFHLPWTIVWHPILSFDLSHWEHFVSWFNYTNTDVAIGGRHNNVIGWRFSQSATLSLQMRQIFWLICASLVIVLILEALFQSDSPFCSPGRCF